MGETPHPPAAGLTDQPQAIGDRALLCPHCEYDLRAATRDQCPECGKAVDRSTLTTINIPWAYRETIGPIRAYFQTLWMFTRFSTKLKGDGRKPQRWADGRRFRIISVILILVVAMGMLLIGTQGSSHIKRSGSEDMLVYWGQPDSTRGLLMTFGMPFAAGINLPWAQYVAVAIIVIFCMGIPRLILRPASKSLEDRETAASISCYVLSPLVIFAFVAWIPPLLMSLADDFRDTDLMSIALSLASGLVSLLGLMLIIDFFINLVVWNYRLNGRRLLAAVTPITYYLIMAFGAFLIYILLTWCVGMILIFATRLS